MNVHGAWIKIPKLDPSTYGNVMSDKDSILI